MRASGLPISIHTAVSGPAQESSSPIDNALCLRPRRMFVKRRIARNQDLDMWSARPTRWRRGL